MPSWMLGATAFFVGAIASLVVVGYVCGHESHDDDGPTENSVEEEGTRMNSAWVDYATKVKSLFADDDDVTIAYDNDEPCLTLYVESAIKADALAQLFPEKKEFGNVTLKIEVLPANESVTIGDLFATAFNGNPAFGGIYDVDSMGYKATYALFAPKVVQYYSDDLSEYGGVSTKTYAQIARDVFDTDSITESIRISSLHMAGGIINVIN